MTSLPDQQSLELRVPRLFGTGFGAFFLFGSLHAIALVFYWALAWTGHLSLPLWWNPIAWHVHEMTAGFVVAVASGFLLTAVPVWTGTPSIQRARIAGLFSLWLLGRLAFAFASRLQVGVILAVDVVYLPALTCVLAPRLLASERFMHRGLVALLLAWAVTNAVFHACALGFVPPVSGELVHLPVHLVVLLVVMVGGRVIPVFTKNALQREGIDIAIRDYREVVVLNLAALVGALLLDAIGIFTGIETDDQAAALRLLAGCLLVVRALGWQATRTFSMPLVWSLYLAFAWLAIGLWLEAVSELVPTLPEAAGVHALAIGGLGGMILAMMSRVTLGHTGGPLVASPRMTLAFVGMSTCAAVRVLGALLPVIATPCLMIAALLWALALALFVVECAPRLLRAPEAEAAH